MALQLKLGRPDLFTQGQRDEGLSPAGHIALYLGRGRVPDLEDMVILGELATLSLSAHRDVFRVLGLGRCRPWGFARSSHLFGGSLEFRTLHEEALIQAYRKKGRTELGLRGAMELPPFDILSFLINDEGDLAYQLVLGVTLIDSGMVIGVDLPVIQQTYTFIAQDIRPLQLLHQHTVTLQGSAGPRGKMGNGLPNGILY